MAALFNEEPAFLENGMRSSTLKVSVNTQTVPILSPCVGICHLGADGYCEGCLRSIDEIRVWRASSDAEKKVIWARIAERAAALGTTAP